MENCDMLMENVTIIYALIFVQTVNRAPLNWALKKWIEIVLVLLQSHSKIDHKNSHNLNQSKLKPTTTLAPLLVQISFVPRIPFCSYSLINFSTLFLLSTRKHQLLIYETTWHFKYHWFRFRPNFTTTKN